MTCSNPKLEARMSDRLAQIHDRLVWISETEAKAALIKGFGANGEFDPERQRLVEETDRLLDELAAIGGSPKYQPKP